MSTASHLPLSDGNRAKRDSRWGTSAVLLFPTDELVGGSPEEVPIGTQKSTYLSFTAGRRGISDGFIRPNGEAVILRIVEGSENRYREWI
ncbi:MAG: hypothetical protein IJ735_01925 [Clostridia bacterium]|nr:hypothetical protein [Clostridia bacterium]